jgi:hypothetical protein
MMPSVRLLFGLIQELILHPSDSLGRIVVTCAKSLPKKSIDFKLWYDFIREGLYTAVQTAVFLLQLSDYDNFRYSSADEESEGHVSVLLLHVSAMLCPLISEHSCYGETLLTLRRNLEFEDYFADSTVDRISRCITDIATNDILLDNISLLISLFPISGAGGRILYRSALGIASILADIPLSDALDDPTLILRQLQVLCASVSEPNYRKAAVIVTLIERFILCGRTLGILDDAPVQTVIKALRCHVNSPDLSETLLREQLHITRTHLDIFLQRFTSR